MEYRPLSMIEHTANSIPKKIIYLLCTYIGGWNSLILVLGTVVIAVGLYLIPGVIEKLGTFGYLGIWLTSFSCHMLPGVPSLILLIPFHGLYPTWNIVAVAVAGYVTGESISYLLGKRLSTAPILNPWINRVRLFPRWARLAAIACISLSPICSWPGLVSGSLGINLRALIIIRAATESLKVWMILETVTWAKNIWIN